MNNGYVHLFRDHQGVIRVAKISDRADRIAVRVVTLLGLSDDEIESLVPIY